MTHKFVSHDSLFVFIYIFNAELDIRDKDSAVSVRSQCRKERLIIMNPIPYMDFETRPKA